jgi:hypothetical protein
VISSNRDIDAWCPLIAIDRTLRRAAHGCPLIAIDRTLRHTAHWYDSQIYVRAIAGDAVDPPAALTTIRPRFMFMGLRPNLITFGPDGNYLLVVYFGREAVLWKL